MSGTYPTTPQPTSIKFNLETPVLKTTTFSGKTRRVAMGIQFYTFSIKYGMMTKETLGPIIGFIAKQYGSYDSFQIVLPKISYRKATDTTTTPTAAASAIGSTSLTVTATASKTILKAGDFFKCANHSKVYMCNTDCTTSGGGTGTLSFTPGLVATVTASESITIDAVPFTVIINNDIQSFDAGFGGVSSMELDMREVW
jgi:hypothetical protein